MSVPFLCGLGLAQDKFVFSFSKIGWEIDQTRSLLTGCWRNPYQQSAAFNMHINIAYATYYTRTITFAGQLPQGMAGGHMISVYVGDV